MRFVYGHGELNTTHRQPESTHVQLSTCKAYLHGGTNLTFRNANSSYLPPYARTMLSVPVDGRNQAQLC
jgi:hypothetical protein